MSSAPPPAENGAVTFDAPAPALGQCSIEASPDDTLSCEAPAPQGMSLELSGAERREKPRDVIRVHARICVDGEPPLDVHTVDLSANGVAINSKQPLNVEQECSIELGISAPELAQPPALRASVRYCAKLRDDEFRIGMKFSAVSVEAAELLVAVLGL